MHASHRRSHLVSSSLAASISLILACARAESPDTINSQSGRSASESIPLVYTGSNARIGLGINHEGQAQGDVLGVLGFDGTRAWVFEGWLGHGGAGGLQAGYHWLWGDATKQDTIDRPQELSVAKAFLAIDQNTFDDRKLSVGVGLERDEYALDVYYSVALTDERLASDYVNSFTTTITGEVDGRPFTQDITVHRAQQIFEHPYDHGVGLRLARFFESTQIRARAGLDYERGDSMLQGNTASQLTASFGLEKHFLNSPHSFALTFEHVSKDGPFAKLDSNFDPTDSWETDFWLDEIRAVASWRYQFGQPFRPAVSYRNREILETVEVVEPQPEVRRTDVQLASEQLFSLNSAEISDAAEGSLRELATHLKTHLVGTVEIVGHTCDLGSDAYNQALSERRANAVRDWLISAGVPAEAIVATGRGESEPRFPNDGEANRARNRRIELSYLAREETVVRHEQRMPQTITKTVREEVRLPAAWIERALRTPVAHKRAVDTYRIVRQTERRIEGERVFGDAPPQAVNDTASSSGGPVTIDVLVNDTDPDDQSLQIVSVTQPVNGAAVLNTNGTVTYTPNTGFTGTDAFSYTIRDPGGLTSTASVTVTTTQPSTPEGPDATDDDLSAEIFGTGDTVPLRFQDDLLHNDLNPAGGTLTVAITRQPTSGTATVSGSSIIYVYTGETAALPLTDSFEYSITDSNGLSDTATVRLTLIRP